MTEFISNYIEAYQADIKLMLDLAEELSLVHNPDVTINGNLNTGNIECIVGGHPVEAQELEPVESVRARNSLTMLRADAKMQLYASEVGKIIPADTVKYTVEQKKISDDIVREVHDQIDAADIGYSAYTFFDDKHDEHVAITSSRVVGAMSHINVRQMTMNMSDAYVQKQVTITEMPVSFDGETDYKIKQTIHPVYDETLHEANQLFQDSGSPEDMDVLNKLFFSRLTGHDILGHEMEDLIAKFEANGKIEQLRKIIEEVQQKADAAIMSADFNIDNPEMTLPSAAELSEYKERLSRIRS